MKISLFENYGAKNSAPVFAAFKQGAQIAGFAVGSHDLTADAAVIWSRLWAGRMRENQVIWQRFHDSGRPVIVLEVGTLRRNHTWRMSLHRPGRADFFGHGIDIDRPAKLGLSVRPWRSSGEHILIACQRTDSQQWAGQPAVEQWLGQIMEILSRHTKRPIMIRPHPRQRLPRLEHHHIVNPLPLAGSYDDFDFAKSLHNAHAVVNFNSGPGIISVLNGVPAFVGASSLAAPVGNLDLAAIESPLMPDRNRWLLELAHTEWTVDELSTGFPIGRLLQQDIFQ